MTDNRIKQRPFLGCFEIALFMRDGIGRFSTDLKAMWQSFVILIIAVPFTLTSVPYMYAVTEELHNLPLSAIMPLYALKMFVSLALGFSFIYMFCKITDRKQHFVHYVTVSNWSSIISLVLYIPAIAVMKMGWYDYNDVYPALILTSLYAYGFAAFITKYVLRIPWELAVFVTICLLAINESMFDILYYIAQH